MKRNRRQARSETQAWRAPVAAGQRPIDTQAASADSTNDGHRHSDIQGTNAVVPEARDHPPRETQKRPVAGLSSSQSGRHGMFDTQAPDAAGGARDHRTIETHLHSVAGHPYGGQHQYETQP